MEFEKHKISENKNKGLSGLANLGNTCFMNSCMQILSHTYELNNLLDSQSFTNKIKNKYDSALLVEWNNLRQLLWNENCIVSPGKFLNTIQKIAQIKNLDMFTGYSQNDLPEFLLFVIDCFHSSVSREIKMTISGESENETDNIAVKCFEMIKQTYTKEYSEIWNLFYAVHVSEIISLENGKQMSITPEPFFMIDLPIPNNNKSPSIIDCFDLYVEGEILEGDNAWYNEEIKSKIDIKKKISFWSFPNILVIDLIFLFNTKHNCKFMSTANWDEFKQMINQNLQPGKVTFAGYPGHVFLIGRHNNGVVLYIDPQVSAYCNLDSPECTFLISNQPMWYLLFNAPTPLTSEQEALVVKYLSAPPANAPNIEHMPDVNEVEMPDVNDEEDDL